MRLKLFLSILTYLHFWTLSFAQTGQVQGFVFNDVDSVCQRNQNSILWAGTVVSARDTGNQAIFYTSTDTSGFYSFSLLAGRGYEIKAYNPYDNLYWTLCYPQNRQQLLVVNNQTDTVDIAFRRTVQSTLILADLSSAWANSGQTGKLGISLQNIGTLASGTFNIELGLDPALTLLGISNSGISVTSTPAGNNNYLLNIQNLDLRNRLREREYIWLDVSASSPSSTNRAYYNTIELNNTQLASSPAWNKGILEVTDSCVGVDSTSFLIKNRANNPTQTPRNYLVIEDDVALRQGTSNLGAGQQETIIVGTQPNKIYRLEVLHEVGIPTVLGDSLAYGLSQNCGRSNPRLFSDTLTHFYTGDCTPFRDVDAFGNQYTQSTFYQAVSPYGYGSQRLVKNGTPLEYLLAFEQTASTPSTLISIMDTMSSNLDWSTLEMGAASHPYTWKLAQDGTLNIDFANINLSQNQKGFVSFKVRPKANLALGTVIRNTAGIYFNGMPRGNNSPVFNTIGSNFIQMVSVSSLSKPQFGIRIAPNPFFEHTDILVGEQVLEEMQLQLFDNLGRLVQSFEYQNTNFIRLQRNDLETGVYFYRITSKGELLNAGKLIAQ